MIGTVVQRHFHVHHRIACDYTAFHLLLYTLVHGANVFARDHAANDFVDEFIARSRLLRLQPQYHVTVLTTTTGLPHEFAFGFFHGLAFSYRNI